MGGSEVITDYILGKRAVDAEVKTVTEAGQKIIRQLFFWMWASSVARREMFMESIGNKKKNYSQLCTPDKQCGRELRRKSYRCEDSGSAVWCISRNQTWCMAACYPLQMLLFAPGLSLSQLQILGHGDFSEMSSGHGVMEGLIQGQVMVKWATDLQTTHKLFLHPRNTLLWRSGSTAPQKGHLFHCVTRTAHFAEKSLWHVKYAPLHINTS